MLLQMALFHSFNDRVVFTLCVCVCVCVCVYRIFFICQWTGCFHVLATVNSAAMNIRVYVSFLISVFVSSDKYLEVDCWIIW